MMRSFLTPKRTKGFTIVELLIVIVVLGILAAIIIVAYNGVQRSAARSVVMHDVEQAAKEIENHRTTTTSLPVATTAVDDGRGIKASPGTTYEYTVTGNNFCVTGTSNAAATSYYFDSAVGRVQEGKCSGHIGYASGPGVGVHRLAVGANTNCRVRDGVPYCWGRNDFRQLGIGSSTTNSLVPIAGVTASSGLVSSKVVTDIEFGYYHGCAIADGLPYCWGWEYLGNGVEAASPGGNPVAVTVSGVLAGKTITDIDVGHRRTCVVADGKPYCWGIGQLGNNGGFSASPVAVDDTGVLSGRTVTKVAVGGDSVCVLADSLPFCWGQNGAGQLGDNTTVAKNYPVAVNVAGVLAGKTITDIAIGQVSVGTHVCVLADGAPYCWGSNSNGALGMGAGNTNQLVPVAVSTAGVLAGKSITSLSLGANFSCVVADAKPYCWGYNIYGQLGKGDSDPWTNAAPTAVTATGVLSGKTIVSVEAGEYHACARDTDWAVYCWGHNNYGNMGDNSTTQRNNPVTINALP